MLMWRKGWRYCFAAPTGPRLAEPAYAGVLARCLTWGIRTGAGVWCQGYDEGWPFGSPFLVSVPSQVGLFVLVDFAPEWFTGLPFSADDVIRLRSMANQPYGLDNRWKPRPAWAAEEVSVTWCDQDDLVATRALSAEGVREWI